MSDTKSEPAPRQIAIGVSTTVIAALVLAVGGYIWKTASDSKPTSVLDSPSAAAAQPTAPRTQESSFDSPQVAASQADVPTSAATPASVPAIPVPASPTHYTVTLGTFYGGAQDYIAVVVGGQLVKFRSSADSGYQGGGGDSSTCDSITVKAGIPDNQAKYANSGTLRVVAEKGSGGSLYIPLRTVASATFPLYQGGFVFQIAVDGQAGVYWTATLSCLTPTGH